MAKAGPSSTLHYGRGQAPDAFWLSDYPETDIDFDAFAEKYKADTRSKRPKVNVIEILRSVVCSAINAYRGDRVVLYSRTKNMRGTNNRPAVAIVDYLADQRLIDDFRGHAGFENEKGTTSYFCGTPALVSAFPGAKLGARCFRPPEFLVELRDDRGGLLKGYRTASIDSARTTELINSAIRKSQIEINGQQVRNVRLHRVFNKSFDLGGRFYHQAQTSPKRDRLTITIDGEATKEPDFRALHIAIAYALVGVPMPPGDPYQIPGMDRKAVKLTALVLLNGGSGRGLRQRLLEEGMGSWARKADLLEKSFWELHHPIEGLRGTENVGLRLQRLDSLIAEEIMLKMAARGVVVLPWHDSFVVKQSHADELIEAMQNAYKAVIGSPSPEVRIN